MGGNGLNIGFKLPSLIWQCYTELYTNVQEVASHSQCTLWRTLIAWIGTWTLNERLLKNSCCQCFIADISMLSLILLGIMKPVLRLTLACSMYLVSWPRWAIVRKFSYSLRFAWLSFWCLFHPCFRLFLQNITKSIREQWKSPEMSFVVIALFHFYTCLSSLSNLYKYNFEMHSADYAFHCFRNAAHALVVCLFTFPSHVKI